MKYVIAKKELVKGSNQERTRYYSHLTDGSRAILTYRGDAAEFDTRELADTVCSQLTQLCGAGFHVEPA